MMETNNVYLGGCYDYFKDIENDSIDLILIDPPYVVTKEKWDQKDVVSDKLSKELFRVLKETGSLYIWSGIGEKSQTMIRWFLIFKQNFYFKDLITWKKSRGMGNRRGWLYTREELMWFVKDNKSFIWNKDKQYLIGVKRKQDSVGQDGLPLNNPYKRITNVWDDFTEMEKDISYPMKLHYAAKPLKAIRRIIEAHTKEGDLILDCFAGSGTTGVAAKELNRNFILIEKEERYCKVCCKRIGLKYYISDDEE